jgi:hypothetical protein
MLAVEVPVYCQDTSCSSSCRPNDCQLETKHLPAGDQTVVSWRPNGCQLETKRLPAANQTPTSCNPNSYQLQPKLLPAANHTLASWSACVELKVAS